MRSSSSELITLPKIPLVTIWYPGGRTTADVSIFSGEVWAIDDTAANGTMLYCSNLQHCAATVTDKLTNINDSIISSVMDSHNSDR